MRTLVIECTCREWWNEQWADSAPFALFTTIQPDAHGLPNAPVTIYVLTDNAMEAAQLLRIAADRLEREPSLLLPIELERDSLRCSPDEIKAARAKFDGGVI